MGLVCERSTTSGGDSSERARSAGTRPGRGRVRRASWLDPAIDLQRLRHGATARATRRLLYRLLVGREGWPPTFRAIPPGEALAPVASEHLYVHLPFCRSICPHCPYTAVADDPALRAAYWPALRRELTAYLDRPGIPPVRSLYIGGGTPSRTPELIEAVVTLVRPRLIDSAVVAAEVHPLDATPVLLDRLRRAGVTRVSLGIETFDPGCLRLLGRGYGGEEACRAIVAARAAGFECLDVDLIFGIPGQRPADAAADADRCLELGADQISAYPLFSFPYTPLGRRIAQGLLRPVGDRSRLRAQRLITAVCEHRGLVRSSVWSFTRPGVEPYSTVTHEDYVGFGVGSGTKVAGEYRFDTFDLAAYIAAVEPGPVLRFTASPRFRRIEWLYWQLYRTRVDPAAYQARFGRPLDPMVGCLLRSLQVLRLADRDDGGAWCLTHRGAVWVHRVQALFSLAYIDELWSQARSEARPAEVALR